MNIIGSSYSNKGQISLFLFYAIMFVIFTVIIVFYFNLQYSSSYRFSSSSFDISEFVDYCVREDVSEGVRLLARNGGYIFFYDNTLRTDEFQVAYAVDMWEDVSLNRSFMESELALFINDRFIPCMRRVTSEIPQEIDFSSSSVDVSITDTDLQISIYSPVTVREYNADYSFSEFYISIPSFFGTLLNVRDQFIDEFVFNQDILTHKLIHEDVLVSILPYDAENIVVNLAPRETVNQELLFNVAVKTPRVSTETVNLGFIPDFLVFVGEEFSYELPIYGENYEIFIDSVLFNLGGNTISFIPLSSDEGVHTVTLSVRTANRAFKRVFQVVVIQP